MTEAAPEPAPEPPREGPIQLLAITSAQVAESGGGGAKRTWNLLQGFERNGIATTVWSIDPNLGHGTESVLDGALEPELLLSGRPRARILDKVRAAISPLPQEIWRRPVTAGSSNGLARHDAVILMGPHGAALVPHALRAGLPVVLDMHDVVDEAMARIASTMPGAVARWRTRIDSRKWSVFQRRLVRKAALVVAVSERDATALRRQGAPRVAVRANGVDIERYPFVDHGVNRGSRLLMTGHFGYQPNLDAARWLTDEIVPRLIAAKAELTLQLVGREMPSWDWPSGVHAARNVPDIQPYFDAADLMIVPLRAGGGTRLKLVEAFAKGLPCVSTTLGCEGLPVEDGVHLLIADTTEGLVAATLRLLDDPELRSRLAQRARLLVEEQFDWHQICADYAADLRSVVGSAGRSALASPP